MFNLSPQKLSGLSFLKSLSRRESRDDLIFSGTVLLAFIFLIIFAWGGYMFYTARSSQKPEPELNIKVPSLASSDLDEISKLLDERDQKFKDILIK